MRSKKTEGEKTEKEKSLPQSAYSADSPLVREDRFARTTASAVAEQNMQVIERFYEPIGSADIMP